MLRWRLPASGPRRRRGRTRTPTERELGGERSGNERGAVPAVAERGSGPPRQEQRLDRPAAGLARRKGIGLLRPALRGPRPDVDVESLAALRRDELDEALDPLARHL